MCSGLPTQFNSAFFRRYLSGPLRPAHLALLRGYFRWVRVATVAPTLDGIEVAGCAVDVCDCRLAEGICQDRVDVCYKLDRQGDAPYDQEAMSETLFREGRARLHIFTGGHKWELCHCCSCCCLIFGLVRMTGEPFIHASGQRPVRAGGDCEHCGRCVDACLLNIRAVEGLIDPARCVGCGVCVAICPAGAWEMRQAAPPPILPRPPRWWAYTYGLLYLGYLNVLMLLYTALPAQGGA